MHALGYSANLMPSLLNSLGGKGQEQSQRAERNWKQKQKYHNFQKSPQVCLLPLLYISLKWAKAASLLLQYHEQA